MSRSGADREARADAKPVQLEVLVVGGGAAGLVAAREAAAAGARTLCLEKMSRPGLKVLISGGGHCNVTTSLEPRRAEAEFGPEAARFLRRALRETPPAEVRQWLHDEGVPTVEEELDKVWPASKRAADVLAALLRRLERAGAGLRCGVPVLGLAACAEGWIVTTAEGELRSRAVILAVGGRSYPGTGTTGDGYAWLERLGLPIVPPRPALAPLRCGLPWVAELSGVTLDDVELQLREVGGRIVRRRRRPLLFTHKGLSGPGPMDLSRDIERDPGRFGAVHVDLVPDRDEASLRALLFVGGGELANRIQRELGLPRRLTQVLVTEAGLDGVRPSEVDAVGRRRLVALCKGLRLPVPASLGFAKAEVTTGGLALDVVEPATMAVRGHPGLYVCGELLDADGPIGGFSFWLAFATGALAGRAAARV